MSSRTDPAPGHIAKKQSSARCIQRVNLVVEEAIWVAALMNILFTSSDVTYAEAVLLDSGVLIKGESNIACL